MSSRFYRNHVLMAFPSFDTATNAWAPQAEINWSVGASREFAFVRFPARVPTEAEAITAALDMAQGWVDERMTRLRSRAVGSEHGRVVDMVEALKVKLAKSAPEQLGEARRPATRRMQKTFTFEQFRSAVAGSGLAISEQALLKSYGALIKLQKNQNWSWAETRLKVERTQRDLRSAASAPRRPKAVRLPLTERDWRRIG